MLTVLVQNKKGAYRLIEIKDYFLFTA